MAYEQQQVYEQIGPLVDGQPYYDDDGVYHTAYVPKRHHHTAANYYVKWIKRQKFPWYKAYKRYYNQWYPVHWQPLNVPKNPDTWMNDAKPFNQNSLNLKPNPALGYMQVPTYQLPRLKTATASTLGGKLVPPLEESERLLASVDNEWRKFKEANAYNPDYTQWVQRGFVVVPNIFTQQLTWVYAGPESKHGGGGNRTVLFASEGGGSTTTPSSTSAKSSTLANHLVFVGPNGREFVGDGETLSPQNILFDIYERDDPNHGRYITRGGRVYEYEHKPNACGNVDKPPDTTVKRLDQLISGHDVLILERHLSSLSHSLVKFYRHDTGSTMYYGYSHPGVPIMVYGDGNTDGPLNREIIRDLKLVLEGKTMQAGDAL